MLAGIMAFSGFGNSGNTLGSGAGGASTGPDLETIQTEVRWRFLLLCICHCLYMVSKLTNGCNIRVLVSSPWRAMLKFA